MPEGTNEMLNILKASSRTDVCPERVNANDIHGVSLRNLAICGHPHIPLQISKTSPDRSSLPRACVDKRAGSRGQLCCACARNGETRDARLIKEGAQKAM